MSNSMSSDCLFQNLFRVWEHFVAALDRRVTVSDEAFFAHVVT